MMKLKTLTRWMLNAGVLMTLTACASGIPLLKANKAQPVADKVAVELPADARGVTVNEFQDERWWTLLGDPGLNETVETALSNNTDVRLANERLNEAGAVLGIAKSARWPAIFGQLTESRGRTTQAGNSPFFNPNVNESTRLGLGATWELDLWGKIAAQTDAARASLMAQSYNLRGVRLSVAATAASLYTQVRVLGLQLNVLEQTLTSREQAYALAKKRFEVGLINELQLRQTEAEYQTVKAQLPDTREQLSKVNNALSVLLAGKSSRIDALSADNLKLTRVFILPADTPSELLLRRPDLAAAEQQLAASEANLEVARKAFFPSIGLSAFGGRESAALDRLFTGPAKVWNFQAQLTQPIFQAGRLFDERDAAVARRNQAVLQYEASVRTAFQEVYDAIVAQREARERLTAREQQVQALAEVVRLAQLRVDNGVANQLELLDAQRNLLQAQLSWAGAWQAQQGATLLMIRALGGGFKADSTVALNAQ